ncbi:MAG TPA: hypothetical protein VF682_12775 [Pseudomonas sp.]|jgi:hypothetical protein
MKMDLHKPVMLFLLLFASLWNTVYAGQAAEKQPIFLTVFVHDDIPQAERASIRRDYFAWLLKDMESFTERRVFLEFIENKGELTTFKYQGDDIDTIHSNWGNLVHRYTEDNNLRWGITHKYLLLTRHKINSYTLGITKPFHYAAIASMETYQAAAHEIGHMLGGTHEASEVLYKDGWWCETNITPTRYNLRANCYVYSAQNRKIMRNYLDRAP